MTRDRRRMGFAHRWLAASLVALAVFVGGLFQQAAAQNHLWQFVVRNEYGNVLTSNITAIIFTAGSQSTANIYSTRTATTVMDNPMTPTAEGVFNFWTLTSVTSVDLLVFSQDTANGAAAAKRMSFTRATREIKLTQGGDYHHLMIRYRGLVNANTEIDSGFDLPSNAIVDHVWIQALLGNTNSTLDVGILSTETNGDADGYCAATAVATAGWTRCSGALITTAGVPDHVLSTDGKSISFSSVEGGSIDGFIHIWYREAYTR